jgi:hypothetical protein
VVELRCAGGPDKTIDCFLAVLLELCEHSGLGEADLPAFERFKRNAGLGGGLRNRYGVLAHRQLLGDLRHGQAEVNKLLNSARTLSIGQVEVLIVGDDLVHDPLDRLGGGVSCGGGHDVDRPVSNSGRACALPWCGAGHCVPRQRHPHV